MNEWMKNIVGYLLIGSIATHMLPNQKYEQYVRLFTGFLFMILVLQPILKIGSADSFLENKISKFIQEQERLEEEITVEKEAFWMESEKLEEESFGGIGIEPIEQVNVEVTMDD